MAGIPPKPWPTGLADTLEPLVTRVLAPNPSPYTYTGTQTYVVGPQDGPDCAVIDPGPDEEAHVEAILAAVGERTISAIMCTHTHRDHSPAAKPLAAQTGAPIVGCAPLVLQVDGPRSDEAFDPTYEPDRVLADGEAMRGTGWTLTAVATPGHTSNHLCFALEESGSLFTGDHVMGWSTSVVIPPDGDMGDYLASLEKLMARDDVIYHSAHGDAITKPKQLVRGMIGPPPGQRLGLGALDLGRRYSAHVVGAGIGLPVLARRVPRTADGVAAIHGHLVHLEERAPGVGRVELNAVMASSG